MSLKVTHEAGKSLRLIGLGQLNEVVRGRLQGLIRLQFDLVRMAAKYASIA